MSALKDLIRVQWRSISISGQEQSRAPACEQHAGRLSPIGDDFVPASYSKAVRIAPASGGVSALLRRSKLIVTPRFATYKVGCLWIA